MFQKTELTVSSAAPVLKFCASAMLLLSTVGIRSYGTWVSATAKMFIPRFTHFGSLVQKLKWGDGHSRQVCSNGSKKGGLKWVEKETRIKKDGGYGVNIY